MTDDKSFSFKSVLLVALISFVVSGGGGYFLSEWQNRAKPNLIVNSIGFSPSDDLIEIDESLRALSRTSSWGAAFKRFETFESLEGTYESLIRVEKRLERGLSLAESWLKKHENWEGGIASSVDVNDILEVPYCQDTIVGSVLIGMIRRKEIGKPPISFADVDAMPEVAEIFRDEGGWYINLGSQNTGFPDRDARAKSGKDAVKLMAHSFSKGSPENIYFYIKQFVSSSYRDLKEIRSLSSELQAVLLPSSKLRISVSIYNSGNSPVTIKPYMGMIFENEGLRQYRMVFENSEETAANEDTLANALFGVSGGIESTDVKVDSYLPKSVGSQYIFVAPNSGRDLILVSLQPLGADKGSMILDLFNINALRSKVVSVSSEGNPIFSPSFMFGKSISTDDEAVINSVVDGESG